MRHKLLSITCLILMLALTGVRAAERTRPGAGPALDLAVADDCPVRILASKTYVASSLTRDPWAALRGAETERAGRSYGPGESSLVFNAGFRNVSDRDVLAVGLLWQALDPAGRVVYQWISIYSRSSMQPGAARTMHELNVEAPVEVASYRLSVMQVNLADGTIWSGAK